jgi:CRISPR-associated protein Cmr3
MTMSNYFIRLKPVENYFFGGENTFRNNEEDTANYFSRSNSYPQQTTLLGLLRFMLLKSNAALPLYKNQEKANALIGENSFDVLNGSQYFGAIQKISPLFIYHDNDIYRFSLPFENFVVDFDKNGKTYTNSLRQFIPAIEGYNPKQAGEAFVKNNSGREILFSNIFIEHEPKTGIDKQREEGDDKKFYKQICYSLKPGFEFAFFADIETTFKHNGKVENVILNNDMISFGGEQKQFSISIENSNEQKKYAFSNNTKPYQDDLYPAFDAIPNTDRIILISDAYVSSEILEQCKFVMNEIQEFRTVKIAFDKTKFNKKTFVSNKLNLLKRGSVLFVDDANKDKVLLALNNNVNFKNIGFNHYILK